MYVSSTYNIILKLFYANIRDFALGLLAAHGLASRDMNLKVHYCMFFSVYEERNSCVQSEEENCCCQMPERAITSNSFLEGASEGKYNELRYHYLL